MRYVCPKDVKKMLLQWARTVHWKKWAAKHEIEELKEGVYTGLNHVVRVSNHRKKLKNEKHRNVAKNASGRRLGAAKTLRHWLVQ